MADLAEAPIDRNRGLGDLDVELEQLARDLGSAPERVLKTHFSDQVAHLFADPRSTPKRSGIPSPISGKTHSMPTYNSLGPDDGYGVKNARTATIGPNEQGSVSPMQIQSAWRAAAKQRFSASTRRRDLKQSHSMQTKRRPIAIIRRSCSEFADDRELNRPSFRKRQLGFLPPALLSTLKARLRCGASVEAARSSGGRITESLPRV